MNNNKTNEPESVELSQDYETITKDLLNIQEEIGETLNLMKEQGDSAKTDGQISSMLTGWIDELQEIEKKLMIKNGIKPRPSWLDTVF